ncbi:MAG: DUF2273 domain-containing protein [Candidatus Hodarchaeota archaeon]
MITSRCTLTTIIGFLCGFIIYPSVVFLLLCGGVGYFVGQFLDSIDVKNQLDTFNSIHATQDIFHPEDIPEAIIIYSRKENLTSVLIDFRVNSKPQDFRLSVLKNLQEFDFRIIEDANKTTFNLILEYPNCNYPKIMTMNDKKEEIHFDIKERSKDFQSALKKIVPGLEIFPSLYPDLYGDINIKEMISPLSIDYKFHPPPSFMNPETDYRSDYFGVNRNDSNTLANDNIPINFNQNNIYKELIDYPPSPDMNNGSEFDVTSEKNNINHDTIIGDLIPKGNLDNSSIEISVPDLSPDDIKELKDMNARVLKSFLEDENSDDISLGLKKANQLEENHKKLPAKLQTNSDDIEESKYIKIDYSNVQNYDGDISPVDEFSTNFVDKIEKEIFKMKKKKIDPEIYEEPNTLREVLKDRKPLDNSVS